MISPVILKELSVVVTAVVSGILITFVYDLLRIFRRIFSHGKFWIGVEDFIFWIWTTLWIFSVLYRENDGSIRMYTILAMAGGMMLYHTTLSEFFVRIFSNVFRKIIKIGIYPFKKLKIYIIFSGKKLQNIVKDIIINNNRDNR